MLDLPHHRCNSVYVPWLSKGVRRTLTMQNIVRRRAIGRSGLPGSVHLPPSIVDVIPRTTDNTQFPTNPLPSSSPPLRIDSQVAGSAYEGSRKSMGGSEAVRDGRRLQRDTSPLTPTLHASPVSSVLCTGWCGYDLVPGPIVVSILFRIA